MISTTLFELALPVLLLSPLRAFTINMASQTEGFSGTVQYMASSGAPMPTCPAIIAIVMEVPAANLFGAFRPHPSAGGDLYFLHPRYRR
jgi:uncharacterized membrane protein YphA (DoxX/SURF4 family)